MIVLLQNSLFIDIYYFVNMNTLSTIQRKLKIYICQPYILS